MVLKAVAQEAPSWTLDALSASTYHTMGSLVYVRVNCVAAGLQVSLARDRAAHSGISTVNKPLSIGEALKVHSRILIVSATKLHGMVLLPPPRAEPYWAAENGPDRNSSSEAAQ